MTASSAGDCRSQTGYRLLRWLVCCSGLSSRRRPDNLDDRCSCIDSVGDQRARSNARRIERGDERVRRFILRQSEAYLRHAPTLEGPERNFWRYRVSSRWPFADHHQ